MVEAVEIVLSEGLLGPFPHQSGHPGNKDVAERVRIDGVNVGLVLDVAYLFGEAVFEVNVIKVFAGWLKLCLGMGRIDGLGGSNGDRREAWLGRRSRIP